MLNQTRGRRDYEHGMRGFHQHVSESLGVQKTLVDVGRVQFVAQLVLRIYNEAALRSGQLEIGDYRSVRSVAIHIPEDRTRPFLIFDAVGTSKAEFEQLLHEA